MTNVEVKKFQLEPDRKKARKIALDETKLSDLHGKTKVYTNPNWPIDVDDEITVSDVYYDLDAIIKILDQAGEDLGKTNAKSGQVETQLALNLHQHLKDIPRKILFDNQFWYYLCLCSPVYHVHRYDTSKNSDGEHKAQDRLWGNWTRTPISAAYLAYYLVDEVGITATQFKKFTSRLRMWILDQSPLISKKLRKAYILKLISVGTGIDAHLTTETGSSWGRVAEQLGSINLDMLTEAEVNSLIAKL